MTIFEPSRFVASLLVMVVHQGLVSGTETLPPQFATYALSWFFVFSGFILTYRYPQLPEGRSVAVLRMRNGTSQSPFCLALGDNLHALFCPSPGHGCITACPPRGGGGTSP